MNLQYHIEVNSFSALEKYVVSELGIAIVPKIAVHPSSYGKVIKSIADFKSGFTVGVITNEEHLYNNKVIADFIETIRRSLDHNIFNAIGNEYYF
ncbi:substrate-binding domain-containing protein [Bacillus aquiflavi]|uniref:substrate-binding domain-containing protein n=1 Tax=Bacillus aquiflavi TaxID=2672567 RepID=UPI00223BFB73|nr:substrate-binding domain-containing protein [Bacillus aquiflavi]